MKIKICGLKSLDDIGYVNSVDIDYAGFIFAPGSKRKIDLNLATEMKKVLNPKIKVVGVFVNEDINSILKYAEIVDVFQLHGDETDEYTKVLKNKTGKEIIKAYRADEKLKHNIETGVSDYVLVDSFNGKSFGGTGETVDFNIIPETDKKIFLAGGINSENVVNAINIVRPYCIDINSGVETDGRKDERKIKEIVEIIRNLNVKIKGSDNE